MRIINQKELILYKQQDYQDILKSTNIAELLYNISFCYKIPISYQQLDHIALKKSCIQDGHYIIADCSYCHKRHFYKTPCNSFFCRECRNYLTSRIKRNAKKYLWSCNHFYITFTLPPEIQELVNSWDKIKEKIIKISKKNMYSEKRIYYTDLVYKSVSEALKKYLKKHKIETGFIALPHSYGSENLNWFFHLNILISSKGFNKNNKIIDYQINFNELRSIYKKQLHKNFKVFIKDTPQVKFAKKKGSIYISYKKSIRVLLDYFRHIPLAMHNIKKIEKGGIVYQTYKQKQNHKKPNYSSLIDFYNLVMQHIPPHNFRTVRAYGLYSNHHKRDRKYPINPPKPLKSLKCGECDTELTKDDFVGRVHSGQLIWMNPYKVHDSSIFFSKSILDCMDFETQKIPEIEPNGRLIHPVIPPPDMRPPNKLKFPSKDTEIPKGKFD